MRYPTSRTLTDEHKCVYPRDRRRSSQFEDLHWCGNTRNLIRNDDLRVTRRLLEQREILKEMHENLKHGRSGCSLTDFVN